MTAQKSAHQCVLVTLSPENYARLSQLAEESGRTRPGYLRRLLQCHFRNLDAGQPSSECLTPDV